jgi:stearoyl-CoA desaturase (delta-9 desaturase)
MPLRPKSPLNWPVLLFVTLSPPAAIAGAVWWIAGGHFNVQTLLLALVMAMVTGLGITGGYHRLFAHRSWAARWPVRLVLLLAGGAGIEESAYSWCRDHRRHHRYVDRDGDPYNIQRGFWHAHLTWMFRKDTWAGGDAGGRDLWNDPLVRLQHRFYIPSAVLVSLGLPMWIASGWGDAWGGLLIAGLARIVVNQQFTFAINSVCHTLGNRPYSDRHSARDNWVTALFTYGEGFHNFHHEFADDYRNGLKPYHWDPTKWLIQLLSRVRLASKLRTTAPEAIAYRRIQMQEKRLSVRLSAGPTRPTDPAGSRLQSAREHVGAACERVLALYRRHRAVRRSWPAQAQPLELQLGQARLEFASAVAAWEDAVQSLDRSAV